MRAKSSESNSLSSNDGYFSRGNVRESLNQLRLSLNRSVILPRIENDYDDDLCLNEDDVKDLKRQIDTISDSHEEHLKEESDNGESTVLYSAEGCVTDLTCEHYLSCSEESEDEEICSGKISTVRPENISENSIAAAVPDVQKSLTIHESNQSEILQGPVLSDSPVSKSLSIHEKQRSEILQGPVLSESPKINNSLRKSLIFASNHLASLEDAVHTSKHLDTLRQSHQSDNIRSSLRSSRVFPGAAESLAASLHRGLQIIDYHQKSSASPRSSVSFSFEHLALKPCPSADKANASVQTSEEHKSLGPQSGSFICMKCQGREVEDSSKTWIVPAEGSANESATYETKVGLELLD